MALLDEIPALENPRTHRRRKPRSLYGDRAYGTPRNRAGLRRRHIHDHLAAPGMPHGSGLGKVRYVIERTLSWTGQARRLKIRYEKLAATHRAFHYLQLARICCRILTRHF
jgi:transposase